MSITGILLQHFRLQVRADAANFFLSNMVRITESTNTGLRATVRDTDTYNVSIKLKLPEIRMTCTCPYFFQHGDGCKHLWATILTAGREGHLREIPRQRSVKVVFADRFDLGSASDDIDDDLLFDDEELGADDDIFGDDWSEATPRHQAAIKPKRSKPAEKAKPADWSQVLSQINQQTERPIRNDRESGWADGKQLLYILDVHESTGRDEVVLCLAFQERKKDGDWSKPKFHTINQEKAEQFRTEPETAIMPILYGAESVVPGSYGYYNRFRSSTSRFMLSAAHCRAILPLLGRTGRLFARFGHQKEEIRPIAWQDGLPWQFRLHVTANGDKAYHVTGWLHSGEQRESIERLRAVTANIIIWDDRAAFFEGEARTHAWLAAMRNSRVLTVAASKGDAFLRELLAMPYVPAIDLPESMRVTEERVAPTPRIMIRPPKTEWLVRGTLVAELSFIYADQSIAFSSPERGIFDSQKRRLLLRDPSAEEAAANFLYRLGFRKPGYFNRPDFDFELTARLLSQVTSTLLQAGWRVEAEGKHYRSAGQIQIEVTTGIDWFDLGGSVQFDDQAATLPQLLQALHKGENSVKLGDGTFGVLPEAWLKKYGMLAGLGTIEDGQLRFSRTQTGLLDALLASIPEVSVDEAFRKAAEQLRSFEGIEPVDPPVAFIGALREYQREGLGWLQFLEQFGFGGCLADDMGLGKTVQVLAMLANRGNSKKRADKRPSLIVVPRSLVFNWMQEASRFTPHLKVLDHTGLARGKTSDHFTEWDIVLTTYGTLRRDALVFKDARFDYCILDEAQVVKNSNTEQAKAVRLLQANHRLALSGTPIENHLGELWSLFEFLNPGMLGRASLFKLAGSAGRNPDPETRAILAKGLRPFILRRTKQQVAKDLPEKTEQTIYCELEAEQRQLYDELRDHYRQSLQKTIESVGMNRAKIQVLEALLRLRQAACHPGLIDRTKTGASSAKLDMLFPQLQEAMEEGQKTLVFSQFTSFLAIVRARLDRDGIPYEYLDGKTRNRQEKVERFQNDPDCKLFLISLKAGGVGLNLTAAEYVFLLDPWWNPAVEAQAIDRTHRIGQSKPVFAYRIIAKNTVEEKVLELQQTKRNLADAILSADNSVLASLKREDLEMLLS